MQLSQNSWTDNLDGSCSYNGSIAGTELTLTTNLSSVETYSLDQDAAEASCILVNAQG